MFEITPTKYSLGMVFGVFDGFHPGHQHFLSEALKHCDKLIVVVAHPHIVKALKDRTPYCSLEERLAAVRTFNERLEVTQGDEHLGRWTALKTYQPDIVLLGYDQERLGAELAKLHVLTQIITAHFPTKFKSSLIYKNNDPIDD